jgi:AraC-like DNA-binding protein
MLEDTRIVIVVFQPNGLFNTTGISGKELKDRIVESDLIFGNPIIELNNKLTVITDHNEIYNLITSFIGNFYSNNKLGKPSIEIEEIIRYILERQGNTTVGALVIHFLIKERKLQRIFAEEIGLSPQKYLQIVRVHSFIGRARNQKSETNLTQLGYDVGYFDQSHLIRDFKKITGIRPSDYLSMNTPAVNFIEIKE